MGERRWLVIARKGTNEDIYRMLGASSHTESERQKEDYYATYPLAVEKLLKNEEFNEHIWECACGEGHISKVLRKHGYNVFSTDIINRGYGDDTYDFLSGDVNKFYGDIITNPPYKQAQEFIEEALNVIPYGNKVAMLLRLQFLEGKKRRELYKYNPPKRIYVFSGRIPCAKNGDFGEANRSAVAYAWFVWEKGFQGEPVIRWID